MGIIALSGHAWGGPGPATGAMIMQVEHHDLHHEFPEYLDYIHSLKTASEQFGHMYDEYHQLTREVERLEEEDLPVDDFTIENMKKHRVWLKDQMYRMLVAHKNGD